MAVNQFRSGIWIINIENVSNFQALFLRYKKRKTKKEKQKMEEKHKINQINLNLFALT